jgi:FlaA1/EpsC-like NDP-sugar epimerase
VSIQVTGVRPGERLEEELWSETDMVRKTSFSRILEIASAEARFAADFNQSLRELESVARQSEDAGVRELLSRLVQSSAELHSGAHSAD